MVHMKEAGPVRVKLPSKAKRIVDITDGSTIAHDTDSLLYTSSSDSSAIFLAQPTKMGIHLCVNCRLVDNRPYTTDGGWHLRIS